MDDRVYTVLLYILTVVKYHTYGMINDENQTRVLLHMH